MNPNSNRRAGKALEKYYAKRWNMRRVGVFGGCDLEDDIRCIECKKRKVVWKALKDMVLQADTNCKNGKIPVVILHETNSRHDEDYVILRVRDYEEWYL